MIYDALNFFIKIPSDTFSRWQKPESFTSFVVPTRHKSIVRQFWSGALLLPLQDQFVGTVAHRITKIPVKCAMLESNHSIWKRKYVNIASSRFFVKKGVENVQVVS